MMIRNTKGVLRGSRPEEKEEEADKGAKEYLWKKGTKTCTIKKETKKT
jgi:hypothetical protein